MLDATLKQVVTASEALPAFGVSPDFSDQKLQRMEEASWLKTFLSGGMQKEKGQTSTSFTLQ